MAEAGRPERRKRRTRFRVAAFRSPLAAIVVALALLLQVVVLPYHQALSAPIAASSASDIGSIAAGLKATFGDAATLCVQSDDKGAPAAPAGDCDDHCPLCRFSTEVAALIAPDLPALPGRPDHACQTLGAEPDAGAVPASLIHHNRARAPPFAV